MSYLDGTREHRNAGFTKHGNSEKEGSHQLSHQVVAAALKHSKGRGGCGKSAGTDSYSISKAINSDQNVRMKLKETNRKLDTRRDDRIVLALGSKKKELNERTTADRAVQSYKGSIIAKKELKGGKALDGVVESLGNLTFNDGKRGRPIKISTLSKRNG
jgi:hypothetical protein